MQLGSWELGLLSGLLSGGGVMDVTGIKPSLFDWVACCVPLVLVVCMHIFAPTFGIFCHLDGIMF